ncbi:hypothetical protein GCM10022267_56530 [Lentzea roselyniae]|uniref:Uncharacterized protein n=1 Tax=Lentzea roselyniae TaxID=531940 RepID=A0ABP7BL03_9PSEU
MLIHATDTAAALYAGKLTTIISAVNTGLAVVSLAAAEKS